MRHVRYFLAFVLGGGLLTAAPQALAAGSCGNVGVTSSDLRLVRYDPFSTADQQKIVNFDITGPAGQTIWVRIATPLGGGSPRVLFEGQTSQSALDNVSGPLASAIPSSANVLNRDWMRVSLPPSGSRSVQARLTLRSGADLRVGDYPMNLDLRVACAGSAPGTLEEAMPIALSDAQVRVPSLIGVANLTRNTINLGVLPVGNAQGWSGDNGQETLLNVRSTGNFAISVANNQLIMNHVGSSGPRTAATQIPYDLEIGNVILPSAAGSRREVGCVVDMALGSNRRQGVVIRALFPANSAQGKLAGNYRDVVTVNISSSELAAATGTAGCS